MFPTREMTHRPKWLTHDSVGRPMPVDSHFERVIGNVQNDRPFLQGHGSATCAIAERITPVSILNLSSHPSNVSWFIPFRVVDSIKAEIPRTRFLSHVLEKCFERCAPLRANRDATTSPILVSIALGIRASLDNFSPTIVLRRAAHGVATSITSNVFA
jgi:hypothetical protein